VDGDGTLRPVDCVPGVAGRCRMVNQ
jgi:hypothetical protein